MFGFRIWDCEWVSRLFTYFRPGIYEFMGKLWLNKPFKPILIRPPCIMVLYRTFAPLCLIPFAWGMSEGIELPPPHPHLVEWLLPLPFNPSFIIFLTNLTIIVQHFATSRTVHIKVHFKKMFIFFVEDVDSLWSMQLSCGWCWFLVKYAASLWRVQITSGECSFLVEDAVS